MSALHLHMKSGGQMSQSPVVWWYPEVVGMWVRSLWISSLLMWFEDPVGGPYSARAMVRRLSCAGLPLEAFQYKSILNVIS
jgi:hypothetical protein